MAKQPVVRIEDIKDIAEIMTKSEIAEVENSFVRQAVKDKEAKAAKTESPKTSTLVLEEIEVNDRTSDKDVEKDDEGR